jgi:hypothetical protein
MQHFPYCPDFRSSEQSLDVTMQLVPPSWLFSRTINFSTQVRNWSIKRNFSISPIVIGTSMLVGRTSPAFRAISDFQEEMIFTRFSPINISPLQDTLQRLFNRQEASALDTDRDGRTILNVSNSNLVVILTN